ATLDGDPQCEDALRNCSGIVGLNLGSHKVSYPGFSGSFAQKQEIASLVKSFFGGFNVNVVVKRPALGTYTMVMIGGTAQSIGDPIRSATGIAPVDCGNRNDVDIAFVYASTIGN